MRVRGRAGIVLIHKQGGTRPDETIAVLRPTLQEFTDLAKRGNWIPIVREIPADLDTPLSLFSRLDDGENSFLLESVEGGEKWARFSFMGTGARAQFRARGSEIEWIEAGRHEKRRVDGRTRLRCCANISPN